MSKEITKDDVISALKRVDDPELKKDLVTLNMISDIHIEGSKVRFTVVLTTPACPMSSEIKESAKKAVIEIDGVSDVEIKMTSMVTEGKSHVKENLIPGVKNTIAVSSGKGGVGKSTVSIGIAVSFAESGAKVGLLDADIYGPNIPLMLGLKGPLAAEGDKILPPEKYGVKVISMAFFVSDDTPLVWRGPMLHGVIQQFLRDVEWGDLDYLIVDLPPGTGDAQLSVVQLVPVTGAVIVTTPQDVALMDSKKGLAMFKKVDIPLLGIIENMSSFICPHCQKRTDIFSHGGGKKTSENLDVPFLGEIPIDPNISSDGDKGLPIIISHPDSPQAEIFRKITKNLAGQITIANLGKK